MYKLSHELSNFFDLFYVLLRNTLCDKALRKWCKPCVTAVTSGLIPLALRLTHGELDLAAGDNLLMSYVVAV